MGEVEVEVNLHNVSKDVMLSQPVFVSSFAQGEIGAAGIRTICCGNL